LVCIYTKHYLSALRIEWAWSLARKQRWDEEVDHLQEEMRRFIASACYRVQTWLARCSSRQDVSMELRGGLRAYAYRQAYIIVQQAKIASHLWRLPNNSLSWIPLDVVQPVQGADLKGFQPDCQETAEVVDELDDEDLGVHEIVDECDASDVE